jgi:uncharacterized protein
MFSRRSLLLASLGPACVGLYAGIEPLFFGLKRYEVRASSRPEHLRLKVAVVADIHACEPWMKLRHIEEIVEATNALGADVIALLGDYVAGHDKITAVVPDRDWARALSRLRAPSGVYAILGNHDWWADAAAQTRGRGPIAARVALENAGIAVLENDCASVSKNGERFWIAGLGDQLAIRERGPGGAGHARGIDDLSATAALVSDEAPIILLAHEPDIFPKVPGRIALTLSGHTHGGQVRLPLAPPFAPSALSRKYIYGHYLEKGRHLIVSGGLGCSWWPVRLGVPPEILLVDVAAGTQLPWKGAETSRASRMRKSLVQ